MTHLIHSFATANNKGKKILTFNVTLCFSYMHLEANKKKKIEAELTMSTFFIVIA